ncbi:glycosyltransferase 87 family protein [Streptomyces sp. RKAG293]|uniref:glycosyltransferase 87 family protein n=1 Tax=Streptomyces sp. RKAG293 TaxID=2893403 RepID=UPI0027E440FF|nr:glycosyltransferase 87 family protein [Streptomyces sp. RKAG293]
MTATQLTADTRMIAARTFILRRPTLLAAAVCLVSFAGFWMAQRASHVSMIDLMVYRAEGATVRNGGDLYDMRATYANLPTTYPPFAALMFMPLTWIGVGGMRAVATVANLGLLVALVHLSLRLTGRPVKLPAAAVTLAVAAVAVWCEPVWTTLRYGQINLLLAVLVLWDLTRRASHRWAGFGTGIAAGIKLTPALFAVLLALAGVALGWRRLRRGHSPWNPHLRRAAVAVVTFIGTVAMAAVALPHDSRRFWTEMLFAADRVGFGEDTANQSLRGIFARALHTGDPGSGWLLAAAAVGCAGLAVAVAALLAGDRLPYNVAWATVACAVTALLVSPISWSHHWVWGVPMVVLLATEALRRRDALWAAGTALTGALFCSFMLWLVPHGAGRFELGQNGGQMMLSAVYPVIGAAFLTVTGTVAFQAFRNDPRRRRRSTPVLSSRRSAAYDYVNR